MKPFFTILFILLSLSASAQSLKHTPYEDPPNACYENCTKWMENLLFNFEDMSDLLYLEPAVYSGECKHLGNYDPEQTHHAVVMIDEKIESSSSNNFYFSTIFSFFADSNEFENWNLDISRKEMSDYWKKNGNLIRGETSTRVEVNYDDGNPAYIYWMRQNALNGDLYYITYAGTAYKSFCHLKKHAEKKAD